MKKIAIIDIGVGNVKSVENMFRRIGRETEILIEPEESVREKFLVLPGVGSFDEGVRKLKASDWDSFLISAASKEIPILGLCLGMQLLCEGSSEGHLSGMGIIRGKFERFSEIDQSGKRLKVPHMGWNSVEFNSNAPAWTKIDLTPSRYYFVHSYYFTEKDSNAAIGHTTYGKPFVSAIQQGSVIGLQFHPEKSHKYGMQLLSKITLEFDVKN